MGKKTGKPRGRPKGAQNKLTKERLEKIDKAAEAIKGAIPDAFDGDAVSYLMTVYKNPSNDMHVRIDAAKAAAPYERPRLAAVEVSGNQDKPLAVDILGSLLGFNRGLNGRGDDKGDGKGPPH